MRRSLRLVIMASYNYLDGCARGTEFASIVPTPRGGWEGNRSSLPKGAKRRALSPLPDPPPSLEVGAVLGMYLMLDYGELE
jgi:hypothetical protein